MRSSNAADKTYWTKNEKSLRILQSEMGKKQLTHNQKFMYLEQLTRAYRDTYQYKELKRSNFKAVNQKSEILEWQQNRKRLGRVSVIRRDDLLWRFDIFHPSYPLGKLCLVTFLLYMTYDNIQTGYTSGATFGDVYQLTIFRGFFDEWRSLFLGF